MNIQQGEFYHSNMMSKTQSDNIEKRIPIDIHRQQAYNLRSDVIKEKASKLLYPVMARSDYVTRLYIQQRKSIQTIVQKYVQIVLTRCTYTLYLHTVLTLFYLLLHCVIIDNL